jgi:hypothetical protein
VLIADAPGRSPVQNARMFAMMAMVADDTSLATADAKMHYNFWRPITAIRNAEDDGNKATAADPGLGAADRHPEPSRNIPCAHCSGAASTATVLKSEVGDAPPGGVRVASRSVPNSIVQVVPTLDTWVEEVSARASMAASITASRTKRARRSAARSRHMALAKIMRPLPQQRSPAADNAVTPDLVRGPPSF